MLRERLESFYPPLFNQNKPKFWLRLFLKLGFDSKKSAKNMIRIMPVDQMIHFFCTMKRWFGLLMALWILALPLYLGANAIHYQIKINVLSKYQLGKADQNDQICFSGALDKIKLKKEAENQKKSPTEKLSFFGFYFFEKFQSPTLGKLQFLELNQSNSFHSSGFLHKGFASLPYSPPNS